MSNHDNHEEDAELPDFEDEGFETTPATANGSSSGGA